VLVRIIKNGSASTSTVANAVKHVLNIAPAGHPRWAPPLGTPGMVIKSLFDQSVLVVPHPAAAECNRVRRRVSAS
jgi:hypothetical protein